MSEPRTVKRIDLMGGLSKELTMSQHESEERPYEAERGGAEMKCICCGKSNTKENPVTKGPDPFQSEINNDDTEVWECQNCREESAMDV